MRASRHGGIGAGTDGDDIAIADDRWIRLDARYLDIDATVKVDGVRVGTVAIDPTVYGAAFVWSI